MKRQIRDALSITQLDELKCRKRVLRRLGFVDESDLIQLKARVACEISVGDELVLSELLFDRFFNELSPEMCAACLSCFVFEEKVDTELTNEATKNAFKRIQSQAKIVAKVSQESKLAVNESEYLNTFKPHLMEVVLNWANGAPFSQIW